MSMCPGGGLRHRTPWIKRTLLGWRGRCRGRVRFVLDVDVDLRAAAPSPAAEEHEDAEGDESEHDEGDDCRAVAFTSLVHRDLLDSVLQPEGVPSAPGRGEVKARPPQGRCDKPPPTMGSR